MLTESRYLFDVCWPVICSDVIQDFRSCCPAMTDVSEVLRKPRIYCRSQSRSSNQCSKPFTLFFGKKLMPVDRARRLWGSSPQALLYLILSFACSVLATHPLLHATQSWLNALTFSRHSLRKDGIFCIQSMSIVNLADSFLIL